MTITDPDGELLAELLALEALLDEALEESFPASDPIAVLWGGERED